MSRRRTICRATPHNLPCKEPLVVFAGEAGPRKGVDVLLNAWPAVHARHPDWRLVVAGPLASDLADRPLPRAVTMLGAVSRAEVHCWQARARIAVLPSRQEALPMSLLEAMAHGCAVVATPVGEVANVVDGCGIVVPIGDTERLAAALDQLTGDPAAVVRLGAAARARVDEHYSAATVATLLQREWAELLKTRC